ncbi:MAG: hypothetical protein ACYDHY_09670 [Acidiferrobacterales bacterium]
MSCEKNRARSMSKLLALLAASSALPLAMLLPKEAAAYNCYGNYCPNAGSPVVGGFYDMPYYTFYGSWLGGTAEVYFGNVNVNFHYWQPGRAFAASCPANTASITANQGYQADNGQWYSYQGKPITLCVATDTYALP